MQFKSCKIWKIILKELRGGSKGPLRRSGMLQMFTTWQPSWPGWGATWGPTFSRPLRDQPAVYTPLPVCGDCTVLYCTVLYCTVVTVIGTGEVLLVLSVCLIFIKLRLDVTWYWRLTVQMLHVTLHAPWQYWLRKIPAQSSKTFRHFFILSRLTWNQREQKITKDSQRRANCILTSELSNLLWDFY